jgi:uncharacterized protein (DUF2336 family)
MQAQSSLLRELEHSIRDGSPGQRVDKLRRVTDLFVHRADQYNEEQVELFDSVIGRLAAEIEKSARAELANRLAPLASAPPEILRALAHDEEIAVSGPVLAQSPRLSADDLIEIARTKGQAHLLAISGRARLSPAVTDVLVERGDGEVAHRVVANEGAAFSETGLRKS